MPQETPNTPESQLPLKYWYEQMNAEDKLTIEIDIFNALGEIPIEYAMDNVHDQESARRIMSMFRRYVELKNTKMKEKIKAEAKEINAYITSVVLPR